MREHSFVLAPPGTMAPFICPPALPLLHPRLIHDAQPPGLQNRVIYPYYESIASATAGGV